MAEHGGNLDSAEKAYGFAPGEMTDISTGIAPFAYDVAMPRSSFYQPLPLDRDLEDLYQAARGAYLMPDNAAICAGSGSQTLIGALPQMVPEKSYVWCPEPTYNEHCYRWEKAGHHVDGGAVCPKEAGVIILGQPNNPTGHIWSQEAILGYLEAMRKKQGLLIIDEAFADAMPEVSAMGLAGDERLVILRSLGKFYGLAGLRVGFAIGGAQRIAALSDDIGPWPVSQPAIDVARGALRDTSWQERQRTALYKRAQDMADCLQEAGFTILAKMPLFVTILHDDVTGFHDYLARHGFWTRIYQKNEKMMRLGLIGDRALFERFAHLVAQWQK